MSEYPVITNKYAAKAEFSGNIVNGLYVYEVDTTVATEIVTAVIKKDKKFVEFEKPYETGSMAGNKIKVTGKATIYGYDYLGQPIKETIDGSSSAAVSTVACWKYIEKIELDSVTSSDTTVKIENNFAVCSLPFKSVDCISATKNTSGTISKATITVTAPNVTKNGGSTYNTRGTVALTGTDSVYTMHLIADNSTVVVDGEEVGGLFGNPINI